MSNHYSSINRAWLRPAILRKASRHPLRTRTWTITRFVLCWLHHLYLQERQANGERLQVYHSVRENLMSSSSQDPLSTERPGALCKYSELHMRYIQSLTHPSTHVKRERTERKTSRLQAQQQPHQEGLALCFRVILDSGAYRWVQAGHPRYTGASTEEDRGWPDVTSTKTTNNNRRQDTDKRQDKRACNDQVLSNVNSHTVELGFLHVVVFMQKQVESGNVF